MILETGRAILGTIQTIKALPDIGGTGVEKKRLRTWVDHEVLTTSETASGELIAANILGRSIITKLKV